MLQDSTSTSKYTQDRTYRTESPGKTHLEDILHHRSRDIRNVPASQCHHLWRQEIRGEQWGRGATLYTQGASRPQTHPDNCTPVQYPRGEEPTEPKQRRDSAKTETETQGWP